MCSATKEKTGCLPSLFVIYFPFPAFSVTDFKQLKIKKFIKENLMHFVYELKDKIDILIIPSSFCYTVQVQSKKVKLEFVKIG